MNLTRRGFLKTCLAFGAAPAIVKAESLMKLWVPPQDLWVPPADIVVPMPEMVLETYGAQIEQTRTGEYVASVYFRRAGDNHWQHHSIRTTAPEQPRTSIRPDGTFEFKDHPTLSHSVTDITHSSIPVWSGPTIKGRADQELILGDPKGVFIGPDTPSLHYSPPQDLPDRGWELNASTDNQRLLGVKWSAPKHFKKRRTIA